MLILLFATGLVQVWHVYVILFVRSLGGAFHRPAMTSSTSLMVPKQHLARVAGHEPDPAGRGQHFRPAARGAAARPVLPTEQVLAMDIGTAALAVLPLLFISIPQPPRQVAQANGIGAEDLLLARPEGRVSSTWSSGRACSA